MIPGKKYAPEDFVAIAWQWKWLLVVPCVIGAIGAYVYGRTLTDRYRSDAVIMMTPQRVREDLVRSAVRSSLADRIHTISAQIMSRSRLEAIVVDLNLYPRERQTGVMEDVVERMRRDVSVQMVRGDAFRVAYVSESPIVAMRVAERLAGLFIDENLKDREQLAQGTSQFLESQLDDARKRLLEQEKRLEAYRRAHAGQLPSQVQSNLAAINSLQQQAERLQSAINRDQDQLQIAERQLADANPPDTGSPDLPTMDTESASVKGGTAAQQLEAARSALRGLELRLKPDHPDIGRLKRLIVTLEAKAEREALDVPITPGLGGSRNPAEAARLRRVRDLEESVTRLRQGISAKEAAQERIRRDVTGYQQRLDAAPTRETELIELMRDYDTLTRLYTSLLGKSEDSKLSVNLEARQVGQQFRILDPARVPSRPYSPNRSRIYAMGAFGGLGLGVAVVFLIVYRDTSLKTDDDVIVSLGIPVLALVPWMHTTLDYRRRRQRQLLLGGASVVLVLALAGGAAWWIVTRT